MQDRRTGTVNLAHKRSQLDVDDPWPPNIVGVGNGKHRALPTLGGEFFWHHHEHADEVLLVVRGHLSIHLRDRLIRGGRSAAVDPRRVYRSVQNLLRNAAQHAPGSQRCIEVSRDQIVVGDDGAGTMDRGSRPGSTTAWGRPFTKGNAQSDTASDGPSWPASRSTTVGR